MHLIFVDETSDSKFKDYFGICMAIINSAHYKTIKSGFQSILRKSLWDENVEFKGAYLFSAKKGDPKVNIEQRISICNDIIELNTSKANARMKFYYAGRQACKSHKGEYLRSLPLLLKKGLPRADKKHDKDVVSINCDFRDDISSEEVLAAIHPTLKAKNYALFESVVMTRSNFETIGILYADIVGYLAARIDTITNDIELFENIPHEEIENNGKIRKLRSSKTLVDKVKKFNWYEIVE